MRKAIIKNGKVANIVLADDPNYKPPRGSTVVDVSDGTPVDIGQVHDGQKFVTPKPSKEEMRSHARMRSLDTRWSYFPAFGVSVETVDYGLISRFAARAKDNPTMTIVWPDYRTGKNVVLNATQIIALNEAITDRMLSMTRTLSGVIDGIQSGTVTDHPGVDWPPNGIPAWPLRHSQSIKA